MAGKQNILYLKLLYKYKCTYDIYVTIDLTFFFLPYLHNTAKIKVMEGIKLDIAVAKVDEVYFNPEKNSTLPNTTLIQMRENQI